MALVHAPHVLGTGLSNLIAGVFGFILLCCCYGGVNCSTKDRTEDKLVNSTFVAFFAGILISIVGGVMCCCLKNQENQDDEENNQNTYAGENGCVITTDKPAASPAPGYSHYGSANANDPVLHPMGGNNVNVPVYGVMGTSTPGYSQLPQTAQAMPGQPKHI